MMMKFITHFLAQIGPQSEYTWTRLIYSALKAPTYHLYFELILIIGIIWLLFKRSYRINDVINLSEEEKNQLINEWKPDSLVPKDWEPSKYLLNQFHRCAYGPLGKYISFTPEEGEKCGAGKKTNSKSHLNFATLNFLNFVGDPDLSEAAIERMKKYGIGSCGPRGFYGTFDVHLELENKLAEFLGVEKAVIYSYGVATFSSAIPSYSKRTDVIFADEGITHSTYLGLVASRSHIRFFRHNNMEHLEQLLIAQTKKDKEDPKRALLTRRFFVVEGIYLNSGEICPLPELIALKYKYKVRILLDETISFGVLGQTGRGLTEYFGVDVEDVDLISGSLETALGVCGGFCAGSQYVVGHQELSGQAYCFSASLPPMLATAACKAISKLQSAEECGRRNKRLLELARLTDNTFHSNGKLTRIWKLYGHPDSPLKHLRLRENNTLNRLEAIVQTAFDWTDERKLESPPLLLTVARYANNINYPTPPPSIRITLNCDLTNDELLHLFYILSSIST
ncbi:Serine palmitoyltransferase 1 isoform 1 [Schistosoma japonicum]|uniref:Serine palmitoyltransferase 1 n=1 Tax=Schistosoma japonicum TaxID=6182 RepID=A0A4Z2CWU0_SCHJA|nr:Serine palmitoyltransferase 1 isoform 1 [Schistosoma japonicum]